MPFMGSQGKAKHAEPKPYARKPVKFRANARGYSIAKSFGKYGDLTWAGQIRTVSGWRNVRRKRFCELVHAMRGLQRGAIAQEAWLASSEVLKAAGLSTLKLPEEIQQEDFGPVVSVEWEVLDADGYGTARLRFLSGQTFLVHFARPPEVPELPGFRHLPSAERREARLEAFGGRYQNAPCDPDICVYCGARAKKIRDHVPPLAAAHRQNGSSRFWLYPACWSCNQNLRAFRPTCLASRAEHLARTYRRAVALYWQARREISDHWAS